MSMFDGMGITGARRWGIVALLIVSAGCGLDAGLLLPPRMSGPVDLDRFTLVARIAQVTDTHMMDEESPARFAGAQIITRSAWRPYEQYSTQILDGIVRTVNRTHASGRTIDFLLHTGDACDNAQSNELGWFLAIMEGNPIDPLSGPDDRPPETRPEPTLDPHAEFRARGLYRNGRHGDLPSIPWYVLFGNHEVYSIGVFPIVELADGLRVAPLPLQPRPGALLPVNLNPIGPWSHGNVTPAAPGPPEFLEWPTYVAPNPDRAFFNKPEFIRAMFDTVTEPPGHGFIAPDKATSWYSVSPVAGLRLIGLDTTDAGSTIPGFFYQGGAISQAQVAFLADELDAAADRGEMVIVATHHPSDTLQPGLGSALSGSEFLALLSGYPNVVLHVCGHQHHNQVTDHGSYVEIETCSTLDLPQEGRLVEIWQDPIDGTVAVSYEMFSHIDDALPALGDDPLRAMRETARAMALADKGAAARQARFDPSGAEPAGSPSDRSGVFVFPSMAAD